MAGKLIKKISCLQKENNFVLPLLYYTQVRHSWFGPRHLLPLKTIEELNSPLPPDDKRRSKRCQFRAVNTEEVPHAFRDYVLEKITNVIMTGGRKQLAKRILYSSMEKIKMNQVKQYWTTKDEAVRAAIECSPIAIIHKAVENATPVLRLVPLTRGGITYQIPVPISPKMAQWQAIKWFVRMNRDRTIHGHMDDLLTKEFLAAYKNEGRIIKAKLDLHRTCEQNRAYAYYRVMTKR